MLREPLLMLDVGDFSTSLAALLCLTAPPVEMTRRDKKACRLERLQT